MFYTIINKLDQLQCFTHMQGDCADPPDAAYGVRAACLRSRQCVLANPTSAASFLNVPSNYDRTQRDSSLWLHNVYVKVSGTPGDAAAIVWYPVPKTVRLWVTSVTIQDYQGGIDVRSGTLYAAGATSECHLMPLYTCMKCVRFNCLYAELSQVYASAFS
jgi:hypothetical protein